MHEVIKPLGGHAVFVLLIQLALLLAAARLGAEAVKRLGLPAVVGELAAGITLGASGLGHFAPGIFHTLFPQEAAQFHLLEVVGLLGMVLLLLLTGLETDVRLLRNLGRAALIASVMGMLVPFATGFGLGYLMPNEYLAQPDRRILFSFFIATAMAISAMPVIAKILMDLDLTRRNIGVIILSAGVVDDTVGWLVLSVIAGAAAQGQVRVGSLFVTLGLTVAFVAGMVFIFRPLARVVVGTIGRRFHTANSDLVFLIVCTFLAAAATEWIGIHAVFGAFVAGAIFRLVPALDADVVHRLESFVFAVLAPLFFGIVGLKVDLWQLGSGHMLFIVLGIACLGKLIGCTVGSLWGGLRFWEALSIAVAMNARGAMELVVATIGLSLGILNQQMFSIIVMVAIVTSFLAPLGLRLTMRKVRVTEEEARRILAERAKGLFDPTRVRVLLPTAGGPNGLGAAILAAGLAKRSAYSVEVLHVQVRPHLLDRVRLWFAAPDQLPPSLDHGLIQGQLEAAGLPGAFREQKRPEIANAIVDEARRGFDFIVMGASSRGQWLGDRVLESVVGTAPCHLAIVKAGKKPESAGAFRSVLVPYDGGILSRVAAEFAARYAEATDAELTVAVVTEKPRWPAPGSATAPGVDADADAERESLLARVSPVFQAITFKPRVLQFTQSPLSNPVTAEAASGKYDLVVVGTENRAIQHRLFFGRDSEELLTSAQATLAFIVPNVALLR